MHGDEDVVAVEPDVTYLEEVAAPDPLRLIAQECRPALSLRRSAAEPAHVPLDGALGSRVAELEELAPNSFGSPPAVFRRNPLDQCDHSHRQARPWPRRRLRTPCPQEAESLPVPAQHGFGLDQHQCLPPAGEQLREHDEDDAIAGLEPGTLEPARGDDELLAEH